MTNSFDYVRAHYGVPACLGRRVLVSGKPGIIVADRGNYIGVNFDQDKPGMVSNVHPTSEVTYLELGTPRKLTRSQLRYQKYQEVADLFENFREFLKYEKYQRDMGI